MKKVFITGANGFIGQKLVDYLVKQSFEVNALIRKGSIPGFKLKHGVNVVIGDLLDQKSLENGIEIGDMVINLAANPYDPKLSYLVNVEGTKKLVKACKKKKISLFIHISSQATKIKNKGVYADSKSLSDEIVKNSGLKYVIIKPSLVYGDGAKGLFNKITKLVSMVPLIPVFGNGRCRVNPISTDDFNKYIEAIITNPPADNSVFDLGSEKSISYNDLYLGILKQINIKAILLHIPVCFGLCFGRLFQILGMKNPPFFIDNVLGSTQETNCNPKSIITKYKVKILNFEAGLSQIFKRNKTKIAVVGLGKMGLLHISILSSMDEVEIVALVDSNQKLFSTIKSMGVTGNFYSSLDEALRHEEIDAVFVLTPTFTHFSLLKLLIKKGKSIFVEKPMTLNENEADELSKLTKKYEGTINVGYTLLFKRCYQKLKQIVDSKTYGSVRNYKIIFEHGEVFGEKNGWMFDKSKSGGGVMMNPGPHVFSLINYLFGVPRKISGSYKSIFSKNIEDEASFIFDYNFGEGEVNLSWSVKGRDLPVTKLEIEFEKARLVTEGRSILIIKSGKRILINESDIDTQIEDVLNINPEANGEAYFVEDKLFIDSVRGKLENQINDINFAIKTEKTIYKCYKTLK